MKYLIFVVVPVVIMSSCSKTSKVERVMAGIWTMDTIYYKKQDVKYCLSSNILTFSEEQEAEFPAAFDNCQPLIVRSYYSSADIKITKSEIQADTIPYRINVNSKNEVFSGNHKVVFHNDKVNRLLKMEVFSDDLYIICRKMLFDYERNSELIAELEEVSWTSRPK